MSGEVAEDYVFHKRFFCSCCDWSTKPSFGDPWYVTVTTPICPECGNSFNSGSERYTMKVVKWIEGDIIVVPEWWKFNKREPGHWEEREI